MKKDHSDFEKIKPQIDDTVPTCRSANEEPKNIYNIKKVEINQNMIQNQQNVSLIIQHSNPEKFLANKK
jgi:hypothetical protein